MKPCCTYFFQKMDVFFSVAVEGKSCFFGVKNPGKPRIWPASYGQFGSLRVNLKS